MRFCLENNHSYLALELSGPPDTFGPVSFGLQVQMESAGFRVAPDCAYWFHADALACFAQEIQELADLQRTQAQLQAMSEFKLDIRPRDPNGYFILRFEVESSFHGNKALVNLELATQELLELARFMAAIASSTIR